MQRSLGTLKLKKICKDAQKLVALKYLKCLVTYGKNVKYTLAHDQFRRLWKCQCTPLSGA